MSLRNQLMSEEFEVRYALCDRDEHDSKGSLLSSKRNKIIAITVVVLVIVALSIGLAVGLSKKNSKSISSEVKNGDGCSSFSKQAVILISLDGFRSDYFDRTYSPNIKKLAEKGVRAKYMRSQFPTKTFPNHFSIVTGLYPESHGIVSNSFKDENRSDYFSIGSKTSFNSKWWKGEPMWNTVRKNGLKSASYFWVGSEVKINGMQPNFWYPYNGKVPFADRVDQVLKWLELDPSKRPSFITLYFNEPDSAGHTYGPTSPQVNEAIKKVDDMIGRLVNGIEKRKLSSCVNIVLVSDHGMASISCSRGIFLDQFTSLSNISVVGQGASSFLYLNNQDDVTKVMKDLKCKNKNLRAFRRGDDDTPKRVHFSNNKRIGDIFLLPDVGWSVLKSKGPCNPKYQGAHGYDNIYKEMGAMFVGNGPAFKTGLVAEPFSNIEVYNLLAEILDVTPAPNNGTFGSLSYLLKKSTNKPTPTTHNDANYFSNECKFICQPKATTNNCSSLSCPSCNTTNQNTSAYMLHLNLNDEQRKASLEVNLPWGTPKGGAGKQGCILVQKRFVTAYSSSLRIPLFVGYKLTSSVNGSIVPTCLRQDPRLRKNETAACEDYKNSKNYTRGQLAPISDFLSDDMAQEDAFLLSNSLPQHALFAGKLGLWKKIQDITRLWAAKYGPLQIMAGSIFDSNADGFRDNDDSVTSWLGQKGNSPAVPTHFYKIVTRCNQTATREKVEGCNGRLESLTFVFPHTKVSLCKIHNWETTLLQYTASINDVEKLTGSNLFPDLPAEFAAKFKSNLPAAVWSYT